MKNEVVVNEIAEFDYLNKQTIEQLEEGIWEHKGKMAQSIIEIGARLLVAKSKLNHGEWGKWLEEKVEISHRTANNWMKVATEFGNTNSQAISNLEGTKVIMLLDVPLDMRDQFMEENDIKNMTTREMKQAIKDMKNVDVNEEIYDKIQKVSVEDLKDFPKHEKYYPNITGDRWMKFLESIKRNGVLEPILITIDNLILSGHQRVRACRDLGIEKINVSYYKYTKAESHDKQNKIAFCIGNCTRGQMDLYNNAMIMMGFKEGIARNPKEIITEHENKIMITEQMKQVAYDIVHESNKISELFHSEEIKKYDVYDFFYDEFCLDVFCLKKYITISETYKNPLSDEDIEDIIEVYSGIMERRMMIALEKRKIASEC